MNKLRSLHLRALVVLVLAPALSMLVGRVPLGARAMTGGVTEFPLATSLSSPRGITSGPDGNLWFTEETGNKIGRITPAGTIAQFVIPTAASAPLGIAQGADGNLWFTESTGNKIGRITPTGAFSEFVLPTASSKPNGIA